MYVIKATFGDDTRRVTLDIAEPNFGAFRSLTVGLFTELQGKEVSIKYVDEDGDRVTITSDLELAEALRVASSSTTKVLRIVLTVKTVGSASPVTSPQPQAQPQAVPAPAASHPFAAFVPGLVQQVLANPQLLSLVSTYGPLVMTQLNRVQNAASSAVPVDQISSLVSQFQTLAVKQQEVTSSAASTAQQAKQQVQQATQQLVATIQQLMANPAVAQFIPQAMAWFSSIQGQLASNSNANPFSQFNLPPWLPAWAQAAASADGSAASSSSLS
jgi:hypothetical protein